MSHPRAFRCSRCGSLLDSAPGVGLADVCFSCIAASLVVEPLPPLCPEFPTDALPGTDETAPRVIGCYELLREIARGGMGVVWLAKHQATGRLLALKMLPHALSADPVRLTRFRSEATLAARLIHPGIVGIRDIGDHNGIPFFVMDYIEGRDLGAVARNKPLPHREAARIVLAVAISIQFAHEQGVLHRDLKPSNVLLDADQQPHVSDFGIAKLVEPMAELTGTGDVLGSPSFMAPEQVGGRQGSAGVRTDVYGLGGLLYFCLTGRAPFTADSIPATLHKVLSSNPVPPSQWIHGIPSSLDRIVLRCLEKDPSRRFTSAAGLAAELERALRGEPLQTREAGPALWLAGQLRALRSSPWLIVFGMACAGATALATFHLGRRSGRPVSPEETHQRDLLRYVSDVALAARALGEGNPLGARRHLESAAPSNAVHDLSGFEWHWLFAQTSPRTPTVAFSVPGAPSALQVARNGQQILLGDSNSVRIVPLPGGPDMARHPLPLTAGRRSMVVDESGLYCWVGDDVGVHQLNLTNGLLRSVHTGPVVDLQALTFGHTIVARIAHSDGSSHDLVFDGSTGSLLDPIRIMNPESPPKARAVTRSRNGLRMAWTDPDGMLRVQNLSNGVIEISAPVAHARTSSWLLDPTGSYLVQYGSTHGPVTVRSAPDWSHPLHIGEDSLGVVDACFRPNSDGLLTLSRNGRVHSWPLKRRQTISPWDGPVPESVQPHVVISPNGSRLAVGWVSQGTASGRVWDCGDPAQSPAPMGGVPIAFSTRADQMLLWHPDGSMERIRLDASSERRRFRMNPSPGGVPDQLSPDAGFFACLGEDGRLRMVHARSGQLLPGPTRSVRSCLLAPDGKHFLFTGMGGAFLGSLRSPEAVVLSTNDVTSMAFHPQGRLAAVGFPDGHIRLFDAARQQWMGDLMGMSGSITSLAFSADGRSLASGSEDGSIGFWNWSTSRELLRIRLASGIQSIVFHPDGRRAVVVRHRAIETLDASDGIPTASPPVWSNPGGFWDTP